MTAAREADVGVAPIDLEALDRGDSEAAVSRVPRRPVRACYRGFMLTPARYRELERVLGERGLRLHTSAAAYQQAHEFPGWYPTFSPYTPASVLVRDSPSLLEDLAAAARELPEGPGVLKDFVKSRKDRFDEACYVPDVHDARALVRVAQRFLELRGPELAGGLVLRHFEPLSRSEQRVLWKGDKVAFIGRHPEAESELGDAGGLLARLGEAVAKLGNPSVVTDLALRTDLAPGSEHAWRVVEVGDAQVSDRPPDLPPALLLSVLGATTEDRPAR